MGIFWSHITKKISVNPPNRSLALCYIITHYITCGYTYFQNKQKVLCILGQILPLSLLESILAFWNDTLGKNVWDGCFWKMKYGRLKVIFQSLRSRVDFPFLWSGWAPRFVWLEAMLIKKNWVRRSFALIEILLSAYNQLSPSVSLDMHKSNWLLENFV